VTRLSTGGRIPDHLVIACRTADPPDPPSRHSISDPQED